MTSGFEAPLTLGTAGHIDHGKTVLVEALTGTNTDRLPEERERGISIELGFAALVLPSGRPLSVVDVPGHERFVRTMVAGASGIDLFLLVVAADDGVMPQTREHLAVLRMLEVPAGVVAVTKTDVVEAEGVELAVEDVLELLAHGPYAGSDIVPVCAPARRGLTELVESIDQVAARTRGRIAADREARLHVDRSFTLTGAGTVVTGTLWDGPIEVGEEIRIEPAGRTARVRSVQVHDRACVRAAPGQRVALNLAGVDRRDVRRGDVVTASTRLAPTYLVDAAVELLAGTRPLRRGSRVQVHHGTRETPARVAPVEADLLEPGHRGFVQLRLERPLVPAAGDRLVIRQIAPPDTIGGGVVVDPSPRKHGSGAEHTARLRLLSSGDPLERLEAALAQAPAGLEPGEADSDLLERLARELRAQRAGTEHARYFTPERLRRARAGLATALSSAAAGAPQSRGALADAAGVPEPAARAILEDLIAEGEVVARGAGFLLAARADVLDPAAETLLTMIAADGLEPRGVEGGAAAAGIEVEHARRLLDRLALEGRLVRVKPGLYYHPGALDAVERAVTERCRRSGSVTIAELRDDLGTSRKYSQALLEYLDARRVTLRQGDRHVLRQRAGGARV